MLRQNADLGATAPAVPDPQRRHLRQLLSRMPSRTGLRRYSPSGLGRAGTTPGSTLQLLPGAASFSPVRESAPSPAPGRRQPVIDVLTRSVARGHWPHVTPRVSPTESVRRARDVPRGTPPETTRSGARRRDGGSRACWRRPLEVEIGSDRCRSPGSRPIDAHSRDLERLGGLSRFPRGPRTFP